MYVFSLPPPPPSPNAFPEIISIYTSGVCYFLLVSDVHFVSARRAATFSPTFFLLSTARSKWQQVASAFPRMPRKRIPRHVTILETMLRVVTRLPRSPSFRRRSSLPGKGTPPTKNRRLTGFKHTCAAPIF